MPKLSVPIRLRWSDLDAYGHVNNVSMLRLLEEARIDTFWVTDESLESGPDAAPLGSTTAVLDGRPGSDTITVLARQEIEYLAQLPYTSRPLDIRMWLGRLGGASLDVCYEVASPVGTEPAVVYARAATTVVLVDRGSGRPRRISAIEREAWGRFLDAPIVFRRS